MSAVARFFWVVAKARHFSTVEQSSRVEVSLLPPALESGANKALKSYPQGTAFESRIGAAPVCAKSTRKVFRVAVLGVWGR